MSLFTRAGVLERVHDAEVRAERVADERHLLEPHLRAPLLERVDEEGLGLGDARGDVVALRLHRERDARGAAHAEPVEREDVGAPPAGPVGDGLEVAEVEAEAGTVAVQHDGRGRGGGGAGRRLDREGIDVMLRGIEVNA